MIWSMFALENIHCASGIKIQQLICYPFKLDILISGARRKERLGWAGVGKERPRFSKDQDQDPEPVLLGLTGPPWAVALSSRGPLGLRGDCVRELLEPLSQRKAFEKRQGTTANSKLFALQELPGAQVPFLVDILDGRPEHNNAFPRALWQSQEHRSRHQALRRPAPGTQQTSPVPQRDLEKARVLSKAKLCWRKDLDRG